mmetsp:Transcript_58994/g.151689  ORF Transcript_58994/g.151689 Transcript_58994/m.151689 type:complete len:231 (-) Transcript_58994:1613-2305(-)
MAYARGGGGPALPHPTQDAEQIPRQHVARGASLGASSLLALLLSRRPRSLGNGAWGNGRAATVRLLDPKRVKTIVVVAPAAFTTTATIADEELCIPHTDPISAVELSARGDLDEGAPLRTCVHHFELVGILLVGYVKVRARRDRLVHRQVRQQGPSRGDPSKFCYTGKLRPVRQDYQGGQRREVVLPAWHHFPVPTQGSRYHWPVAGEVTADDAQDQGLTSAPGAAADRP